MNKNKIREGGIEALEWMLLSNPVLSILNLQGISLGDDGLLALLNGMKVSQSLISLNIKDNNLTSNVMESLREYLVKDSNIVELKMGGNPKIGNKGMKTLAPLFMN